MDALFLFSIDEREMIPSFNSPVLFLNSTFSVSNPILDIIHTPFGIVDYIIYQFICIVNIYPLLYPLLIRYFSTTRKSSGKVFKAKIKATIFQVALEY